MSEKGEFKPQGKLQEDIYAIIKNRVIFHPQVLIAEIMKKVAEAKHDYPSCGKCRWWRNDLCLLPRAIENIIPRDNPHPDENACPKDKWFFDKFVGQPEEAHKE